MSGNSYGAVPPWLEAAVLTCVPSRELVRWLRQQLDRHVGRRRMALGLCIACGYDLTGNVSGVCPECGKATANAQ